MMPDTRNDGLHLQLSGVDVVALRVAGAIPGIVVLNAAARNGPGIGTLVLSNGLLTWQAPGSITPGTAQGVSLGGMFMVEDGADPSKWLRVQTYPSYLPPAGQAQIYMQDTYNALGPADVAAADALAGLTTVTQYTLLNVTNNPIFNVKLWLDNTAAGFSDLSVSSDGTTYHAPTSAVDPNVLTWASIARGASVSVWVKRVVSAASASNPSILNVLQWQWQGIF